MDLTFGRDLTGIKQLLNFPFELRAHALDRALAHRPHHYLAVCAIFRNEAPFFDEWVTFHLGIGVSHFFLYNNFSDDDYEAALAPWIEKGIVTLHQWPVKVGQMLAYSDCVRRYRMGARWIAFIDLDEFLFSPDAVDVRPILQRYEDLPGVVAGELFFGSSGHETRPVGPLLEAFTRRSGTLISGKTIANPRHVRKVTNAHLFKYFAGSALDTSRAPIKVGGPIPFDVLRINHYWSRSLSDLVQKVARGDASSPDTRILERHLSFEGGMNEQVDASILPIARAIRSDVRIST